MSIIIVGLVVVIVVLLVHRNQRNSSGYQKISAAQAQEMIIHEPDLIIVDVRRQDEYLHGHIKGAKCIPNEIIGKKEISELPDHQQKILVYCRSGNRSRQAANKLILQGYENVFDFGGIIDWKGEIVK